MSESVMDILKRADESYNKAQEVKRILAAQVQPYQVFCRTISGITVTLDGMLPTTTVAVLKQKIAAKDGTPPEEQRLIFAGKQLEDGRPLALYGVGKESTVHCVLKLRGGHGERGAIQHVVDLQMGRGNVGPDVLKTEGRSYALKAFGRKLKKSKALEATIRKKFKGSDEEWEQWWARNRLHVKSVIQETTHAGNCGDFAQVVASSLVNNTEGQYVYQIVMTGTCPGPTKNPDCTFKKPHNFDHQLCVTYPIADAKNGVTRSDKQMRALKLPGMDPTVATVADGWHNHRVITLGKWMDAGGNCYHKVGFANLKIVAIDKCGAVKLSDNARKIIAEAVEEEIADHEKTDDFAFDRFIAVWDAAPKGEKKKGGGFVAKKYGLVDNTPGSDFDALKASMEAVFNKKRDSFRNGFRKHYQGYATASKKKEYLKQLDKKMKGWKWKDPKKADFLKAVESQAGLDEAVHILLGADTWVKYVTNRSSALPTFGMNPMGGLDDLRSDEDIDTQLVAIPASNWALFEEAAMDLSADQLLGYASQSKESCFRVMHLKTTREALFDHLKTSNTPRAVRCFQMMEQHLLTYVEYAKGANVLGSTSEGRLHAVLAASSNQAQIKRIVGIMDIAQAWRYVLTLDATRATRVCGWMDAKTLVFGLKRSQDCRTFALAIPAVRTQLVALIPTLKPGRVTMVCKWLTTEQLIDALNHSADTRKAILEVAKVQERIFGLFAEHAADIGPLLDDAQRVACFMHSAENRAAMIADAGLGRSLKASVSAVGASAYDQVFDCGDDTVIKAVMDLFSATELEAISEAGSATVKANLERLSEQ